MINEWLAHIKKTTPEEGILATQDIQGNSILIDWKRADILSPHLSYFKKSTSELASEEIALAELEFLRAYPEAASQELFLKACEPLLKDGVGSANWAEIEEKIRVTIKQFYSADLSKFGSEIINPLMDDLYFFGTVKDKGDDRLCGFFIFAITPALPFGNIKVINLVVRSHERDRGLEKAMLRAIIEIIPQTNRIFLFVRPTNVVALEMYKDLGFVANLESFLDPNHKVNTDYLTPLEFNT
jgi:ribosomal protein S18 acetylase RimI-like enzyme